MAGDKRALARAISLVEDDDPAGWELVREVYPRTGRAAIFGFTGPPGVGKSTLIGALTKVRREADRNVAVLSIDPSSPFTRGALLGDRIRLSEHFLDPGVFIRSMANRGALGGLSEAALQAALLMDAAGKDDVFLETVGVGPGRGRHHRPRRHRGARAAARLRRLDPGAQGRRDGDPRHHRGQQGRPPADRHDGARDPGRALARAAGGLALPIVNTEAARGEGVEEIVGKLDEHRAHIEAEGTLAERRRRNLRAEVIALATGRMRRRLEADVDADPAFGGLLDEVVARRLDPASAATELLEREQES